MKKWGVYSLIIGAILLADRLTKWLALSYLSDGPISVLPFFNLVLVWNKGVSFGLLTQGHEGGPYLLSALSLVIVLFLGFWFVKSDHKPLKIAISAAIAGALGNIVDRLLYGAVVDFLDFHAFGHHWPAFNIADSAIVLGIAFIAFDSLFWEPQRASSPDGAPAEE